MSTSNAVSESARAAVVGYKITKGDYSNSTPNLPQRIAIISPANTDMQTGLSLDPFTAVTASAVAAKLGAGSPAYLAMRILRPLTGGGVSGIPTVVYPVVSSDINATASTATITVSGTSTANCTHYFYIGGRNNIDGQYYAISVLKGNTALAIAAKIAAAIGSVYGSPVKVTFDGSTELVTLTSKCKGLASIFGTPKVDVNGVSAGLSYAFTSTDGTGADDVETALGKFENQWNTLVINPYGSDSTVLDLMESVNGRPDPDSPTGRYAAIVFKPFLSFFSKSTTDPVTDVSVSTRASDCTNVYCPAPNCFLTPVEVAANVVRLVATIAQDSPNLDVNDKAYPDAVVLGTGIGNYHGWDYRDEAVKAGLSTVDYVGGDLIIKDLVTTYNPTDEVYPQFAYVRNLILDWNIRYAYRLLEATHVVNHTLVPDGTVVSAEETISPSQWKGILHSMFEDLAKRGLIADADFSKDSLTVSISSSNPDRFETFFRYKRTGIARICSTTAEAGFYYGD
ncbi:MAG: hypothetical protein H6Q17_558 [Bacteroidetes bacterium]|nr:hypothetical protein [Bacteroidota bacterium]